MELALPLGVGLLVVFLVLGVPVAFAMGGSALIGLSLLIGPNKGLAYLMTVPLGGAANFSLAAIPLFMLMSRFAVFGGLADNLYAMAYKWMGHLPGGLAMGTTIAMAGFGAISGSSTAAVATFGPIGLSEMSKYGYSKPLSLGVIASAGTFALMIPPSIAFVVFGMLSEVSVGKLFIGGIIPGVLTAVTQVALIALRVRFKPSLAPRGPTYPWKERFLTFKGTWAPLLLVVLVLGGIYMGWATPTEAAALGAIGALAIGIVRGAMTRGSFTDSLRQAGRTSAMIFLIMIGALVFGYFLTLTKGPQNLILLIQALGWAPWAMMILFYLFYLILGMFLDAMAIQVLTVPLLFPVVVSLGFDPIWFGVVFVKTIEIGMITPPVGMNGFVLQGVTREPLETIFAGTLPFVLCDLFVLALMTIFPQIVLFLPNLMK